LILDEPTNDLDSETIDLLIDFINSHNGSALISSHDIDFLERTCKKFFIFDGTGLVIPSNSPYLDSKIQPNNNDLKKIKKKEKPLSAERKINRILKKIESKEIEINNITKQLQTIGNFKNDDSEYKMIIQNLKDAQHELDFLEKEWIEIEENSIKNA